MGAKGEMNHLDPSSFSVLRDTPMTFACGHFKKQNVTENQVLTAITTMLRSNLLEFNPMTIKP